MKKIFLPSLLVILLSSCYDNAKISVQNKVHNATLTSISWDKYSLGYSLLPGETSKSATITDENGKFPKRSVVKFYMRRGDNQVYLETKYAFTLDSGDNLLIIISDTTQVINPALWKFYRQTKMPAHNWRFGASGGVVYHPGEQHRVKFSENSKNCQYFFWHALNIQNIIVSFPYKFHKTFLFVCMKFKNFIYICKNKL